MKEENCRLYCRRAQCENHDLSGALLIAHAAQADGHDQGSPAIGPEEEGDGARSFRSPRCLVISLKAAAAPSPWPIARGSSFRFALILLGEITTFASREW